MSTELIANQFFQSFSPAGRDLLISRAKFEMFQPGDYLFQEGDPADGVCLVLIGEVAITKLSQGREVVLAKFMPGDYFGEVAVLDGFGRSSGAKAETSVRIAKLPRDEVLQVLNTEQAYITISLFQKVLMQLRTVNQQLVQEVVNKEKTHFVGEMANSLMHDFRNPIASMRFAADNLSLVHKDEKSQRWCEVIRIQSDRMIDMTRELMEFSRGETSLEFTRTNIMDTLEMSGNLLADYLEEAGVMLLLEVSSIDLDIDVMRMLRVFQNLISNAVDALQNQAERKLEIKAWEENGLVYITVEDNGPGIPEQIQSTLFDPFVTFGKKNGTGLGMAIVHNIISAHRGSILFETEAGKGTRFIITLPQFQTF